MLHCSLRPTADQPIRRQQHQCLGAPEFKLTPVDDEETKGFSHWEVHECSFAFPAGFILGLSTRSTTNGDDNSTVCRHRGGGRVFIVATALGGLIFWLLQMMEIPLAETLLCRSCYLGQQRQEKSTHRIHRERFTPTYLLFFSFFSRAKASCESFCAPRACCRRKQWVANHDLFKS